MNLSDKGRTLSNPQRVQLPSIRQLLDLLPPTSTYRYQHLEHPPVFTGYQKDETVSPRRVHGEQTRPSERLFSTSSLSPPPASVDRSSSQYTITQASSNEQVILRQFRVRNGAGLNYSVNKYRDNANADGVASSQIQGRSIISDSHSAASKTTSGRLTSGKPAKLSFSADDHDERRKTGQPAQVWSATPPPSRYHQTDLRVHCRDKSAVQDPFHRITIGQTTQTAQTTLTAPTPQTAHGHPPSHTRLQPWNLSTHSSDLVPGKHQDDIVNAADGLAMLAAGIGARPSTLPTHPGCSVQPVQSAHMTNPIHSSYLSHSTLSPYPQHPTHPSPSTQSTCTSDAIHPELVGLLRQSCKEDLPRVLSELTEEAGRALAEGRAMKTINEYSRTIARFAEFFVRAKGSVVATPEQVKEMYHRAVLICRLAHDLKAKILAKKKMTEAPKRSAVLPAPVTRPALAKRMTKQQIKDMKKVQKKRNASLQGIRSNYTKRKKNPPAPPKCSSCCSKETSQWQDGPEGPRTLCNGCGTHYARLMKKRAANEGNWIGAGSQPTIDIVTLRQATGVGIQPQLNERGEVEIPGVLININRDNLLKEPLSIGAKPPPPRIPFQRPSFIDLIDTVYGIPTSASTPTTGNIPSKTPTTSQIQKATLAPALAESFQKTPPSSHMDIEPTGLSATPSTAAPPNGRGSMKRKAVSDHNKASGIARQPAGKRRKLSPQNRAVSFLNETFD